MPVKTNGEVTYQDIVLPYASGELTIPNSRGWQTVLLRPPEIPEIGAEETVHALQHPVGTAPLPDLARGKKRVLIVLENATRPTPTPYLLKFILQELKEGGVAEEHITFLFANGAHKGMEPCNRERKLGPEYQGFPVHDHDCDGETVCLGTNSLGSSMEINPLVLEADLCIGLGTVEPHHGAGTSGGAKILFPGCAGLNWIKHSHNAFNRGDYGDNNNTWRQDMEESAKAAGLDFIVNAVLNYRQEIIGLWAGHFIKAHRAAQELALRASVVQAPKTFDAAVSSATPFDLNFILAMKGITPNTRVVKEGGGFAVVASCEQGLGGHGWLELPEITETMRREYQSQAVKWWSALYSTNLDPADLHHYMTEATPVVRDPDELKELLYSKIPKASTVAVIPNAPVTIFA